MICIIDFEEFEALLSTCAAPQEKGFISDRNAARNYAILWVPWDTGIRVGELCDLQLSNLDRRQVTLIVFGKGRKERRVALGRNRLSALLYYLDRLQMLDGNMIERDIVERPESVLLLPVGQQQNVMLIEEYDFGAGTWQLTLPGGKVNDPTPKGIVKQAQAELREETGFRAGRFERLLDLYSHPGYINHRVH